VLLLDIVIQGRPPSKNARTRFNRRTGVIHTDDVTRAWMEAVAFEVRLQRKAVLPPSTPIAISVVITVTKGLHTFDLDGALPCLVDAVFTGLSDSAGRPPDQWLDSMTVSKQFTCRDETHVEVFTFV
jgi:hypothetical protein